MFSLCVALRWYIAWPRRTPTNWKGFKCVYIPPLVPISAKISSRRKDKLSGKENEWRDGSWERPIASLPPLVPDDIITSLFRPAAAPQLNPPNSLAGAEFRPEFFCPDDTATGIVNISLACVRRWWWSAGSMTAPHFEEEEEAPSVAIWGSRRRRRRGKPPALPDV